MGLRVHPEFPVDDAYISFHFARNLAAGQGLVFNPGVRVEGFSNPLWVLLLAAGQAAGLTPRPVAFVASLLLLVGILGLAVLGPWRDAARPEARGLPEVLVALAVFAYGADLLVGFNAVSGLEAPLAAFLLALAAWAHLEGRGRLARFTLLALVWTRPEAVLLALAWAALEVHELAGSEGRGAAARRLRTWGVEWGLPLLASLGLRLAYFHSLIPTCVRAKMGRGLLSSVWHSLAYTGSFSLAHAPLVLALVLAAGASRGAGPLRRARPILGAAWMLLGLSLVTGHADPYQGFQRYLFPLVGLAPVLLPRLAAMPAAGRLRPALILLLVLQALQVHWRARRDLPSLFRPDMPALMAGVREVLRPDLAPRADGPDLGTGSKPLHRLAAWFREHARAGEVFATAEVGISPYYNPDLVVVDTFGLVDPQVAATGGRPSERDVRDYVFGRRPQYVGIKVHKEDMAVGIWTDMFLLADPRLAEQFDLHRIFDSGQGVLYLFVRRAVPLVSAATDLLVPFGPEAVHLEDLDGVCLPDADAAAAPRPSLGPWTVRHSRPDEAARLREELRAWIGRPGGDPALAETMRRWLALSRRPLGHDPLPGGRAFVVELPLEVPAGARLRLGYGLFGEPGDPAAGDGVEVRVELAPTAAGNACGGAEARLLLARRLAAGTPGWRDWELDLGALAGERGRLRLLVFPGEAGDVRGDRGGWSPLRLVMRRAP